MSSSAWQFLLCSFWTSLRYESVWTLDSALLEPLHSDSVREGGALTRTMSHELSRVVISGLTRSSGKICFLGRTYDLHKCQAKVLGIQSIELVRGIRPARH